jgi:hypothetical protein
VVDLSFTVHPQFILELSNLGIVIQVRVSNIYYVPDPIVMGMRIIFYSWVTLVSNLNRDGYGTDIFFLTGNRYFTTVIILYCE